MLDVFRWSERLLLFVTACRHILFSQYFIEFIKKIDKYYHGYFVMVSRFLNDSFL